MHVFTHSHTQMCMSMHTLTHTHSHTHTHTHTHHGCIYQVFLRRKKVWAMIKLASKLKPALSKSRPEYCTTDGMTRRPKECQFHIKMAKQWQKDSCISHAKSLPLSTPEVVLETVPPMLVWINTGHSQTQTQNEKHDQTTSLRVCLLVDCLTS